MQILLKLKLYAMYYVCIELQIDRVEMSSANSREIILSIFIRLLKIKVFLHIIENIFFIL